MILNDVIKDNIIDDIYGEFYKYLAGRNPDRQTNHLHCSALAKCKREVVLDYFGFKKKPRTLATYILFELANFIHKLFADAMEQSGKFKMIGNEYDISDGLPDGVSGRSDLFMEHIKHQIKILIDTKTAHPNLFIKKYDSQLPNPDHLPQMRSYDYGWTNLNLIPDLLELMYFDRGGSNTPQVHEVTKWSKEEMESLFNEYKKVIEEYRTDKIMPPKLELNSLIKPRTVYLWKEWNCGYCDFEGISCSGYPTISAKEKKPTAIARKLKGKWIIEPGYEEYQETLNNILKPKEYTDDKQGFADFVNDVNKGDK